MAAESRRGPHAPGFDFALLAPLGCPAGQFLLLRFASVQLSKFINPPNLGLRPRLVRGAPLALMPREDDQSGPARETFGAHLRREGRAIPVRQLHRNRIP